MVRKVTHSSNHMPFVSYRRTIVAVSGWMCQCTLFKLNSNVMRRILPGVGVGNHSPWAFPLDDILKICGACRNYGDYRAVKSITKTDQYYSSIFKTSHIFKTK